MRNIGGLLALAAASFLTLTGCTVNYTAAPPSEPAQVTAPSTAPAETTDSADPEQEFLAVVKVEAPVLYGGSTDRETIAAGYAACDVLGNGVPVAQVLQNGVNGGSSMNDVAVVVWSAVAHLCPEFTQELADFVG